MLTRNDFIAELKTERAARRKIWKQVPGHPGLFLDPNYQTRFDVLCEIISFLQHMTEKEFAAIEARRNVPAPVTGQIKLCEE